MAQGNDGATTRPWSHDPALQAIASLCAAYLQGAQLSRAEILSIVTRVTSLLASPCDRGAVAAPPAQTISQLSPGEIEASITDGGLRSFEDGKVYRTLKRHLKARGLTPAEYRAKWGLPAEYPMTSRDFSVLRSALSTIGASRAPRRSRGRQPSQAE